jgi:hypothetical protein
MRFILKCLTLFSLLLFLSARLQAQTAIKIGKKIKRKTDMTVQDLSKINNMVKISNKLKGWKVDWKGNLLGSQATYSHWSSGGVNAINATASTYFTTKYRKNRFGYAVSTNLLYGRTYVKGEGTRKTNDRIAINSKITYLFADDEVSLFGDVNFNTQFDQGYNYNVPDSVGRVLISGFFSPAYLTEIIGIGYVPAKYFTAEAGLALKETFVKNDSLTTQFSLPPGDNFRIQPGFSIRLGLNKKLFKNIKLISAFQTFTNVNRAIRHTQFTFYNKFVGKVNDFLNMTLEFDMVYNDNFSKRLQIKENLAAGLSVKII